MKTFIAFVRPALEYCSSTLACGILSESLKDTTNKGRQRDDMGCASVLLFTNNRLICLVIHKLELTCILKAPSKNLYLNLP